MKSYVLQARYFALRQLDLALCGDDEFAFLIEDSGHGVRSSQRCYSTVSGCYCTSSGCVWEPGKRGFMIEGREGDVLFVVAQTMR